MSEPPVYKASTTSKRRHHKDPAVMMFPYFKVAPSQLESWKKHTDAFYKTSLASKDMLFCCVSYGGDGAYVRQGYRNTDALLTHVQRTETFMAEASMASTLERVEVHGSKAQLMKVKSQTTQISGCSLQCFEVHPKMPALRRPTKYTGGFGTDKLVTYHASIEVKTVEELRVLEPKVKCVHRRASNMPDNESFMFSRSLEQGLAMVVASFDSMEGALEHLACMVANLGKEAISHLNVHGPELEMEKLGALVGKAETGLVSAATMCEVALAAACQHAVDDAKQATACAQVAAKACARRTSDGVRQARDKTAAGVHELQKRAEEMAREIYKQALKVEGATEDGARALAKAAYKHAMDAVNDMRERIDHAGREAYDAAQAAGKSAEQTVAAMEQAALAAGKAAHEELKELTGDAGAAFNRAKAAGGDTLAAAKEELEAMKMSMELGALELKRQTSDAAKQSRKAMMNFYDSLKADALIVVEALYRKEKEAQEVSRELYSATLEKSKSAAYATVTVAEHVYMLAYEKAVTAGKAASDAKDAATKAAEDAARRAADIWKEGAHLTADAAKAVERMSIEGEKAFVEVWSVSVACVLDSAKAMRWSLYKAGIRAEGEVQEAAIDVVWVVSVAVQGSSQALGDAYDVMLDRIHSWYAALTGVVAAGAASVAAAVHAVGNSLGFGGHTGNEKFHADESIVMCSYFTVLQEKIGAWREHCKEFHRVSSETTDVMFYGESISESGTCIRHGFRDASAMVSYLQRTQTTMSVATETAALEKVEVHSTRRQLVQVKMQVTSIGTCSFDFFEEERHMRSIRRPTSFSGKAGSEKMVSAHVSVKMTSETEAVLGHKLKAVHRCARDNKGIHSFSISKCMGKGVVRIMGEFTSMEAGVEHLACSAAHLGEEAMHGLELHGPKAEMDKVEGLLGKAASSAAGTARAFTATVRAGFSAAEKAIDEDCRQAKAFAAAASAAAETAMCDTAKKARDSMTDVIEVLQKQAEEVTQEVYKEAMKAEHATEDWAIALAKRAYRASVDVATEVRQAADDAARKAYERAVAAGKSAEAALEEAQSAAEAAANAMKDEFAEAAEATEADAIRLKEEAGDAAAAVEQQLAAGCAASKAAADFAAKAAAGVARRAAKEAREAMLSLYVSLRKSSDAAVAAHYKTVAHTEERIAVVRERARAASWSVVVTHEEAFYASYERCIVERTMADKASHTAMQAAGRSVDKVLAVWKQSEDHAADSRRSAAALSKKQETAMGSLWESALSYRLESEKAFRQGLYRDRPVVEQEVHESTEDVAWAVSRAVSDENTGVDQAHEVMARRVRAWYEASSRPAIEEYSDPHRKQRLCC